jgi:hypothetical protein
MYLDLHHRPKLSGLYLESLGAQGGDEAFIEQDGDFGRAASMNDGRRPFAASP